MLNIKTKNSKMLNGATYKATGVSVSGDETFLTPLVYSYAFMKREGKKDSEQGTAAFDFLANTGAVRIELSIQGLRELERQIKERIADWDNA